MTFLEVLWHTIILSAPFLILGLIIAGFIKQFVPIDKIKKWLGDSNYKSVFKASIIGVPLPLCSCSVIPTAVTLKKSGASNAATSSFLISTPESGVDSIAMTYALMDLPMTILRPLAAFVSAFFAGVLQIAFNSNKESKSVKTRDDLEGISNKSSCCKKNKLSEKTINQGTHLSYGQTFTQKTLQKTSNAFKYGFGDLINDIAIWFSFGIFLSAIVAVIIPDSFFLDMGAETSRLLILLVATPLYICASATTPIAAALVLKGLSPGAALLLLLVGPATNISNIVVIQKFIGKKGVILNITAILFIGLFFSYITDYFYSDIDLNWLKSNEHLHENISWWEHVLGGFLSLLLLKGVWIESKKKLVAKKLKNRDTLSSVNDGKSCH